MKIHPSLHPDDRTLRDHGLGQLDERAAVSVRAHLEACPDCRRRAGLLSSVAVPELAREAVIRSARPGSRAASGGTLVEGSSEFEVVPAAAAPPPFGSLPPGLAELPNYEIVRELGRGGMGVVYLARNTLMGRQEVLKVVGGHLVSRTVVRERFLREIRSAARLHHPNVVTAYTAMQIGEGLVLAMEYFEGLDLSRVVKASGPMPVAKACAYVQQAAQGLQHAHEHDMVHRDIKPGNLMLARTGKRAAVKVLDFGLAKVSSEGPDDSGLTREGQMLGTPDYIAPEQIRDAQSADIRADIYSLGCTFYYLLTGRPPFTGASLWDLYQAHFSMDAGPLHLIRPEVPEELNALVAKMMAKDAGHRFQTPGDVARALASFVKPAAAGPSGSSGEWAPVPAGADSAVGVGGPGNALGRSGTLLEGPSAAPAVYGLAASATPIPIPTPTTNATATATPPRAETRPADEPARRPPWLWPSLAAGVVGVAAVAGTLAFTSRTGGVADPPPMPTARVPEVVRRKPAPPIDRATARPAPSPAEPDGPVPGGLALSRDRDRRPGGVPPAAPPPDRGPVGDPSSDGEAIAVDREIVLFNGMNLEGWVSMRMDRPAPNFRTVMLIASRNELFVPSNSFGRLQTTRSFRNFLLMLEYRLAEHLTPQPRESGVLLVPSGDLADGFAVHGVPTSRITCRIKPGEAGTLNLIGDRGAASAIGRTSGAERPAGQWNELGLQVDGKTLKCSLNGSLVQDLECQGPPAFHIALWAQGTEVAYRRIRLVPATDGGAVLAGGPPAGPLAAMGPAPAAATPAPLAPGTQIQEDFRGVAAGQLPAGWSSPFKNATVVRRPAPALVLKDPRRPERVDLPRVDLAGDYTIDVEFILPAPATSVQLQLQGAPTENLYLSVFGNGMVQVQVRKKRTEPGRAFQPNGRNKLRLQRRGGKSRVELNDVDVGDIPINIGEVHYRSLYLTFGPAPPPADPSRPRAPARFKAAAPQGRGPVGSPRILSLRVAAPRP